MSNSQESAGLQPTRSVTPRWTNGHSSRMQNLGLSAGIIVSKYSTLVQIKCFQRKHKHMGRVIPHRYRIANAWYEVKNGVPHIQEVGREGWWPFPDGFCPNYLGEMQAIILQETIEPKVIDGDRSMEADSFENLDFNLTAS